MSTEPQLLEQIHYDVCYFGEDREAEIALVEVLAGLPEDVREFALERCRFASVGRTVLGYYIQERELRVLQAEDEETARWLVIFSDDLESNDLRSLIAHEIAHLWLGHQPFGDTRTWLEKERETCSLVKGWGFKGKGADPTDSEEEAARRF